VSYMTLRGRWCDITVLKVHAPGEDKYDDKKGRPYEELECVLDQFPMYYMKMQPGDFNAKFGRRT
jgi:hypothetical protein